MRTTNDVWCPKCGALREKSEANSTCPLCSKPVASSTSSTSSTPSEVKFHDRVQLAGTSQVGFPCPECGVRLNATPEMSRMLAKCPGCQELITLPTVPNNQELITSPVVPNKELADSDKPIRKSIPKAVQRAVWRRDRGKCVECGSNENLEYDHIIPHSKGGGNTERNIQLLCEECNRSKGAKIGGESV